MFDLSGKIKTWLPPEAIEHDAMLQISRVAGMPFLFKHVAVMPDCHLGKGATVGTVLPTRGAIIPAAVGVDIGCGMIAVRTNLTSQALPDTLSVLRHNIERGIPLGAGGVNKRFTASALPRVQRLTELATKDYSRFANWLKQLGSLGSGNHFIEVCLDEGDRVWVVLHSGSRGVGNKIASAHIKTAQRIMGEYFISLPDRDLAYLPEGTPEFDDYIRDLLWAQEFALLNREEMMDRILSEIGYTLYGHPDPTLEVERINCHHNFTQMEHHFGENVWVTRKGAIQMQTNQRGVIPGSMGSRSYIVRGVGNRDAFESAPHGAGRRFSRTEARRRFTMADFETAMKGIECRHDEALIDELPGAYKDIDEVMENSKELAVVEHTLHQVLNVKGN